MTDNESTVPTDTDQIPEPDEEREPQPSSAAQRLDADTILDSLVPATIDWRATVGRHPVVSVLAVGVAGYVVGRTKGSTILAGLSAGLSTGLARQLSDVLDGDFFEFE